MNKFISKFCNSLYQDMKGFINFLGVMTISAYFASVIIACVVYFGTMFGLEEGGWGFAVPYSGYWFFVNISIWFAIWIAKHVRKAMKD